MSVVGRVFGFVNKPLVGSRFSNILESEMCFVDSGFSREVPKKKKKKNRWFWLLERTKSKMI